MISCVGIGILCWVEAYRKVNGHGPSLGRIGSGTKRASGQNRRIVLKLIAQGYLSREPGYGGAIELTDRGKLEVYRRAA